MFHFQPSVPERTKEEGASLARSRWKRLRTYVLQQKYKTFLFAYSATQANHSSRKAGHIKLSDYIFDEDDSATEKFAKAVFHQIVKLRQDQPSPQENYPDASKKAENSLKDQEAYQAIVKAVVYPLLDHRDLLKSLDDLHEGKQSSAPKEPVDFSKAVVDHLNNMITSPEKSSIPLKVSPIVFSSLKAKVKALLQSMENDKNCDQIYFRTLLTFYKEVIHKRAVYVVAAGSNYEDLFNIFNTVCASEVASLVKTNTSSDKILEPFRSSTEAIKARLDIFIDLIKEAVEDACTAEIAKHQKEKNSGFALKGMIFGNRRQKGSSHTRQGTSATNETSSINAQMNDIPQETLSMAEWIKGAFGVNRFSHEEFLTYAFHNHGPDVTIDDFQNRIRQLDADIANEISKPSVQETYKISETTFQKINPDLYFYWRKWERKQLQKYVIRLRTLYLEEDQKDDAQSEKASVKEDNSTSISSPISPVIPTLPIAWIKGLKKTYIGSPVKIRVRIVEAKGLAVKDDDGKSDPYCVVEHGVNQRYETTVVSNTEIPFWDQEVVIETTTKSDKAIKVSVWDKDDDTKGLLNPKFWKDESDDFLGQVLFSVSDLLDLIEKNTKRKTDTWYVLQKRSKRSHVSGEIRIVFEKDEDLPDLGNEHYDEEPNEVKNKEDPKREELNEGPKAYESYEEIYKYLVSKFLAYDSSHLIGELGEGSLSKISEKLLDEFAEKHRLNKIWRDLVYFEAMIKRYKDPSSEANENIGLFNSLSATSIKTLTALYKKLDLGILEAMQTAKDVKLLQPTKLDYSKDGVKSVNPPVVQGHGDLIIFSGDLDYYISMLKDVKEYQQWQIQKYKDCFPCDSPRGALATTISFLQILNENNLLRNTSVGDTSSNSNFSELLCNLIKSGTLDRFQRIVEMSSPSKSNPTQRLVQLATLIMEELDADRTYFQAPFATDVNIVAVNASIYFQHFILEIEAFVADYAPSKTSPVVSTPPEIFDLYYRVGEMQEKYVSYIDKTTQGKTVKNEFSLHSWFAPFIHSWLLNSSENLMSWCENAIQADKLEPTDLSNNLLHSSSVLDLFSCFNQMLECLTKLDWINTGGQRLGSLTEIELAKELDLRKYYWGVFLTLYSRIIQLALSKFCSIISKKIFDERKAFEQETNSTAVKDREKTARQWISSDKRTERVCVQINNIDACRVQLNDLYDHLEVAKIHDFLSEYKKNHKIAGKPNDKSALEPTASENMSGCFIVTVVSAENLMSCDNNGYSDPFCVLKVKESQVKTSEKDNTWISINPWTNSDSNIEWKEIAKTRIISANLNPRWNETFSYILTSAEQLDITVYDYDLLRNELCGNCVIPLKNLQSVNDGQVHDVWLDLNPQGKIFLRIQLEKSYSKVRSDDLADIEYYFRKGFRELKRSSNDLLGLLAESMSSSMQTQLVKIVRDAEKTGKQGKAEDSSFGIMKLFKTEKVPQDSSSEKLVNDKDIEIALKSLTDYLNETLSLLSQHLYSRLSKDLFKKVWSQLLSIVESIILPSLFGEKIVIAPLNRSRALTERQLEMIFSCVEVLKSFFYADGSELGLSMKILESKKYKSLRVIKDHYWDKIEDIKKLYLLNLQKSMPSKAKDIEDDIEQKDLEEEVNLDYLLRLIRIRIEKDQESKDFFSKQMLEREKRLRWNPENGMTLDAYNSNG